MNDMLQGLLLKLVSSLAVSTLTDLVTVRLSIRQFREER
jgi:hypothetical protein